MKFILESTDRIVEYSPERGIPPVKARVFEGTTEDGTKVYCIIPRFAVPEGYAPDVYEKFKKDFQETLKPASQEAIQSFPLKFVI